MGEPAIVGRELGPLSCGTAEGGGVVPGKKQNETRVHHKTEIGSQGLQGSVQTEGCYQIYCTQGCLNILVPEHSQ